MTTTASRRGRRHPVSVAPMMDHTDRHFRVFLRGLTRRSLLYTEMITALAIRHGDREHLLGFSPEERPVALQLGGDDPQALAEAARIGRDFGYDEINLNVGCPSDRVQHGRFGACLMKEPAAVARAVEAMRAAVDLPVTVKHRLGVDDQDRYEDVLAFVDNVAAAGCDRFAVHARKAWLSGLSPRENRTVPPLRWEEVHRLKAERPQLAIEVNGGISTLEEIQAHLEKVDGVMIGRAAYEDPYLFAAVDSEIYGEPGPLPSRREVLERYLPYVEEQLRKGVPLARLSRHTTGLFAGVPGARAWKRHLAENAHLPGAGPEVLLAAVGRVGGEGAFA